MALSPDGVSWTPFKRDVAGVTRLASGNNMVVGVTGEIFFVSSFTGTGLSELRQELLKRRATWQGTTELAEKRSA